MLEVGGDGHSRVSSAAAFVALTSSTSDLPSAAATIRVAVVEVAEEDVVDQMCGPVGVWPPGLKPTSPFRQGHEEQDQPDATMTVTHLSQSGLQYGPSAF